jgi:tetratricopeptide (TPR) repeat protein
MQQVGCQPHAGVEHVECWRFYAPTPWLFLLQPPPQTHLPLRESAHIASLRTNKPTTPKQDSLCPERLLATRTQQMKHALKSIQDGEHHHALGQLLNTVQTYPHYKPAYELLATAALNIDDAPLARECLLSASLLGNLDLKQSLISIPLPELFNEVGNELARNGHFESAQHIYKQAFHLDAMLPDTLSHQIKLLQILNQPQQIKQHVERYAKALQNGDVVFHDFARSLLESVTELDTQHDLAIRKITRTLDKLRPHYKERQQP